jgi:hypothetical protein
VTVEPFVNMRLDSDDDTGWWSAPGSARPEVLAFCEWLQPDRQNPPSAMCRSPTHWIKWIDRR